MAHGFFMLPNPDSVLRQSAADVIEHIATLAKNGTEPASLEQFLRNLMRCVHDLDPQHAINLK
jgi:hypothetical protein